ncbi:hypothetical protein RQP46_000177 [Phenoliferia psychrophenolica]
MGLPAAAQKSAGLASPLSTVFLHLFLPRLPRELDALPFPQQSQTLLGLIDRLKQRYGAGSTAGQASSTSKASDSGYSSESEGAAAAQAKDDAYERAYSKDWLLALVRRGQEWVEAQDGSDKDEELRRERIVDLAAELIAAISEVSESGSIVRPLLLPTSETLASEPLLITLLDALPGPEDPTAVGLQSWGSSIILARMIALNPTEFGVRTTGRTLELGAGTGLLSLVWKAMSDRALAEETTPVSAAPPPLVVATDYHASVLANLRKNVDDNAPQQPEPTPAAASSPPPQDAPDSDATQRTCALSVAKLDWSAVHGSRSFALSSKQSLYMPPPFDQPFDTLLGADIVYGPEHALWLRSCCEQFLARPAGAPKPPYASPYPSPTSSPSLHPIDSAFAMTSLQDDGEGLPELPCETSAFHLIVPLRPTHQLAIASIAEVFPMAEDLVAKRRKGEWKIAIQSMVEVKRVRGVGRVDEGSYRLYRIGWC